MILKYASSAPYDHLKTKGFEPAHAPAVDDVVI